jgi:hypothetical protein
MSAAMHPATNPARRTTGRRAPPALAFRALGLLCGAALLVPACSSPEGTYVTPADLDARGQAKDAPSGGGGQGAMAAGAQGRTGLSPERQTQRDGFDAKIIAHARRREDHARGTLELEQKRTRVSLEQTSATASEAVAQRQAEREHRVATEDLAHFTEVEQARRLAENALELRGWNDNLLETREELAQLEMMYSESDLGDATAEIVLNRTRRRLKRAEDGQQLREQRSTELRTITLPRDLERLTLELAAKTVALENVRRTGEQGKLARAAALRDLDFESKKLVRDMEDIVREETLLTAEIARWERDVAAENAAAAPAGANR